MFEDIAWRRSFRRAAQYVAFWPSATLLMAAGAILMAVGQRWGFFLVGLIALYFTGRLFVLGVFPHAYLPPEGVTGARIALRPATGPRLPAFAAMHDREFQRVNHWNDRAVVRLRRIEDYPFRKRLLLSTTAVIMPADPSSSDNVLGFLTLDISRQPEPALAVGAFIRTDQRGQGLFTEALMMAFELFARMSIGRIHLMCDLDNTAMMRSALKAGMVRQPDIETYEHPDGTTGSAALFRWTASVPADRAVMWDRD